MRLANDTPDIKAPEKARFGILSPACTIIDLENGHWISDFRYEIVDSGVSVENQVIIGASPNKVQIVSSESSILYRAYHPFNIQASIEISTLGNSPEDIQQRAKTVMDIVTQKAVERELWEGGIASLLSPNPQDNVDGNRYFSDSDSVDVTPTPGTAVHPKYGVALLEGALAKNTIGYKGTLHIPRDVAYGVDLEVGDDSLTTKLGTDVVAGVGYTKRGPNGTLATGTNAWMYATGPVTVILGKPEFGTDKLNQSVNPSNNKLSYYIDRPAAVVWSTQHLFAVLVDLQLNYA